MRGGADRARCAILAPVTFKTTYLEAAPSSTHSVLAFALMVALLAACSDSPSPADGALLPDIGVDGTRGDSSDLGQDDLRPPDSGSPSPCQADEACSTLLDAQGACPGLCIAQRVRTTCRGQVAYGLCFADPPARDNPVQTLSGLRFEVLQAPVEVVEGAQASFRLTVTNTTPSPRTETLSLNVPPSWSLVSSSIDGQSSLTFASAESKTLDLTLQAVTADVMPMGFADGRVFSLFIGAASYTVRSAIGYAAAPQHVSCGTHSFPQTLCTTSPCDATRNHYLWSVCCDGVFYPGGRCCADSDCGSAEGCADGQCVPLRAPTSANTIFAGHQTILLVLADQSDLPSDPPSFCTNRYSALKTKLGLDAFEATLAQLAKTYGGVSAPTFKWWVLAGIDTSDFNPTGPRDLVSMHDALETYLDARACLPKVASFDKKIIISPTLDLGPFGGKAHIDGRVGQKTIDAALMTHEILHTYGANDLYNNLGGRLQYARDLMGNNLGPTNPPEFGVAWAEINLGDLDRSGVIDLAEYAVYPSRLVVTKASAQLSAKNTLELAVEVGAEEAGVTKRVLLHEIAVELPDWAVSEKRRNGELAVFEGSVIDLPAIAKAGAVSVRVSASYAYTDANFDRKTATIDETVRVSVK